MKAHHVHNTKKTQAEEFLILFLESGIIYSIIWVIIISPGINNRLIALLFQVVALLSIVSDIFSPLAQDYLGVMIPHLATIYPTAIILLTALNKSHCDSTLKGQSFSQSLQFAQAPAASAPDSTQSQPAGEIHSSSNDLEIGDIAGESHPGPDYDVASSQECQCGGNGRQYGVEAEVEKIA
jgi:hypothetical protein